MDWYTLFRQHILNRGIEYYEDGYVIDFNYSDDKILARVDGIERRKICKEMGNKYMKKRKSIVAVLLFIMVLCACSKKNEGLKDCSEFIGRWQCAEAPLEHPDYYTGYLMWVINEDGSFSMYDAEAGNPGIAGELQIISDKELQLDCNTEDDFDPPVTWEDMQETQVVIYEFVEEKEIHVTFVAEEGNSTLAFYKVE